MSTTIGAAATDVTWSLGFLVRYVWVILLLAAIPAAQRIYAAFHPDDRWVYAWPIELVVAVMRLGTIVVVFWLGWRTDASARRPGLDSAPAVLGALSAYARQHWARLLIAVLIAVAVFLLLNLLGGPVLESVVRLVSDDPRVAGAWTFGFRNMLIIPLFYVFAYGVIRPAFLASGT